MNGLASSIGNESNQSPAGRTCHTEKHNLLKREREFATIETRASTSVYVENYSEPIQASEKSQKCELAVGIRDWERAERTSGKTLETVGERHLQVTNKVVSGAKSNTLLVGIYKVLVVKENGMFEKFPTYKLNGIPKKTFVLFYFK